MIIVFGSINLDLIFSVPGLPQAGQTLLASGLSLEPGGKGANQAVAASLDKAVVRMVGAVGRDAFAQDSLAGLVRAGVDVSAVACVHQPTGVATIARSRTGENQIIVAPGANLAARAAQVADRDLTPDSLLVTQMEAAVQETAALIRRAHARGAYTLLNLAPAAPLPLDALRLLDILVVNEDEGAWLADHLGVAPEAAALRQAMGSTVIRTRGAAGAEVAASDGQTWHEAAPHIQAVDTTAAGDCFVGVLAAALDARLPLRDAVARAVAAASLCCTRQGSQGSLPERAEIDAWSSQTLG